MRAGCLGCLQEQLTPTAPAMQPSIAAAEVPEAVPSNTLLEQAGVPNSDLAVHCYLETQAQ